jgi:hypothetical protein
MPAAHVVYDEAITLVNALPLRERRCRAGRRLASLCGSVALGLVLVPAASAAITIGFTVRTVSPGAQVTGVIMGRDGQPVKTFRPGERLHSVRVYLVAVADAQRLGGPTRSGAVRVGPPPGGRSLHYVGLLRNEDGLGTIRFRVPTTLRTRRYTTLIWCLPCLPPRGSVFLSGWFPDGAATSWTTPDPTWVYVRPRRP